MEYTRIIEGYKELGHMSMIDNPDDDGFFLFAHLIRFRTYHYVVTADIEKMYRFITRG